MKKFLKKQIVFIVVILVVVILVTISILNNRGVEDFSTEQHIAIISKRIEKNYQTEETSYTDFNIYPLYNEKEEVAFYMVEFKPKGFVYVEAYNLNSFILSLILGRTRYATSSKNSYEACHYYNIDIGASDSYVENVYHNGKCGVGYDYCRISPFVLANVQNEQRYILKINNKDFRNYYALAIKQGDKYLNILTNETFTYKNGQFSVKQIVCTYFAFFTELK